MADPASLDYLKSIDASLKALLVALKPAQPIRVDLDGPHGDPTIKAKDPRDWTGETCVGLRFSQCPPDYLDMLADRYDYFAGKETDEKKAGYNRLDAARARGWAKRMRDGWKAEESEDDADAMEAASDGRW